MLKETNVYGHGRTQIPTMVLRKWGLNDGDKVVWIEYSPGSLILAPSERKYIKFQT